MRTYTADNGLTYTYNPWPLTYDGAARFCWLAAASSLATADLPPAVALWLVQTTSELATVGKAARPQTQEGIPADLNASSVTPMSSGQQNESAAGTGTPLPQIRPVSHLWISSGTSSNGSGVALPPTCLPGSEVLVSTPPSATHSNAPPPDGSCMVLVLGSSACTAPVACGQGTLVAPFLCVTNTDFQDPNTPPPTPPSGWSAGRPPAGYNPQLGTNGTDGTNGTNSTCPGPGGSLEGCLWKAGQPFEGTFWIPPPPSPPRAPSLSAQASAAGSTEPKGASPVLVYGLAAGGAVAGTVMVVGLAVLVRHLVVRRGQPRGKVHEVHVEMGPRLTPSPARSPRVAWEEGTEPRHRT